MTAWFLIIQEQRHKMGSATKPTFLNTVIFDYAPYSNEWILVQFVALGLLEPKESKTCLPLQ